MGSDVYILMGIGLLLGLASSEWLRRGMGVAGRAVTVGIAIVFSVATFALVQVDHALATEDRVIRAEAMQADLLRLEQGRLDDLVRLDQEIARLEEGLPLAAEQCGACPVKEFYLEGVDLGSADLIENQLMLHMGAFESTVRF